MTKFESDEVAAAAEEPAAAAALAARARLDAAFAAQDVKGVAAVSAKDLDLGQCLDLEATHHVHPGLTSDHRDAARAFVEKREPVFRGR